MIPKNFEYIDSFVLPKELQPSTRKLSEHITKSNRWKYFLELKIRRESIDRITYKLEDFPFERLVYILVWNKSGKKYFIKGGQSQHCWQRIGSNYISGTGANTGWLSPALFEFLKAKGGEIEIYGRGFDNQVAEKDDDIEVFYAPRLDKIEKYYQDKLNIEDGKEAINKFFSLHNFSYIIK